MTQRSIRRAQERAQKKQARQANPISAAQLQANRANAAFSTGPSTEPGKAVASLNAVKTALTGRTVLLPPDDAARYERHLAAFICDHRPVGPRECDLVQSIADTSWRLARIPALEAALYTKGHIEFATAFDGYASELRDQLIAAETYLHYEKHFRNLHLQEARLFRRYGKESAELRQLQKERREREAETPAENGFVFSNAPLTDNTPFEPVFLKSAEPTTMSGSEPAACFANDISSL